MTEKLGIDNLKEVVVAAVKGAVYGIQLAQGNPFSLEAAMLLVPSIIAAVKDVDQVGPEASDIDPEEMQEIIEAALTEIQPLGIVDPEKVKPFIEVAGLYTEGTIKLVAAIENLKS